MSNSFQLSLSLSHSGVLSISFIKICRILRVLFLSKVGAVSRIWEPFSSMCLSCIYAPFQDVLENFFSLINKEALFYEREQQM